MKLWQIDRHEEGDRDGRRYTREDRLIGLVHSTHAIDPGNLKWMLMILMISSCISLKVHS